VEFDGGWLGLLGVCVCFHALILPDLASVVNRIYSDILLIFWHFCHPDCPFFCPFTARLALFAPSEDFKRLGIHRQYWSCHWQEASNSKEKQGFLVSYSIL
jgi:hypothetical protein